MADEGEKMPIRLVQENGDTISLDATSVDIVVERAQSNFGIPFFNAKKMAIDVNQATLGIEVQGVLADDTGQETSSKAIAKMEFYQPQSLISWGSLIGGHSGGGVTTGPTSSGFNQTGSNVGAVGANTGIGGVTGGTSGFSGGFGGSGGETAADMNDLGNRILDHWHGKHIKFPVAKWIEAATKLDNPVSSGLQLWLKADSLSATHDDEDLVTTWTDSSNSRNAEQATTNNKPTYTEEGVSGMPYVWFNGVDNYMAIPFNAFLNSEEFTILTVMGSQARSGALPIISTTNGTPGSSEQGFSLSVETDSGEDAIATWNEGGTTGSLTTAGSLVPKYNGHIIGYIMDDTTANGQADTVKIFVDGKEGATVASGVDYVPVSATAEMRIGRHDSSYFHGAIYEILLYNRVLTTDERQQVEGYLGRKYGIDLIQEGHPYEHMSSYNYEMKHINIGFDKKMVGSKEEPYGFVNTERDTELRVTGSPSSGVTTFSVSGGDPRDWFELTENDRDMTIEIRDSTGSLKFNSGGSSFYGTVTAVTSSSITVTWSRTASTISLTNGDQVYIKKVLYGNRQLWGQGNEDAIIIPIKNADTYVATQDAEKAVGPEFPAYQDTSARDTGGGITRTDEYITYLFSKALTSSYLAVHKAVNTAGDKTMNKAFSTIIGEGSNGHNTHLTITQEYASSLGQLSDAKLETNLGIGQMPISPGFTGGKSGKRVKSGGDKTQDILGILGNSANFTEIPDKNFVTDILGFGLDFIQPTIYKDKKAKGDFIRGIQIPYNTLATKGKSAFDAEVAQRNFFATTEGNTSDKISSANKLHASQLFSHTQEGHMKNGMSGIVTDFNVHRDAEMKAYEFSLKFVAADIIL